MNEPDQTGPASADTALLLQTSKLMFAIFAAIEEHIDQDFDLAHILFVMILRTQPDTAANSAQRAPGPGRLNVENNLLITANIYEIAKYTGMNRATVRRKMHKLAELGLITRIAHERWVFDGESGEPSERLRRLTADILRAKEEFLGAQAPGLRPQPTAGEGGSRAQERLSTITMPLTEARRKISKGAFHVRGQPAEE